MRRSRYLRRHGWLCCCRVGDPGNGADLRVPSPDRVCLDHPRWVECWERPCGKTGTYYIARPKGWKGPSSSPLAKWGTRAAGTLYVCMVGCHSLSGKDPGARFYLHRAFPPRWPNQMTRRAEQAGRQKQEMTRMAPARPCINSRSTEMTPHPQHDLGAGLWGGHTTSVTAR